MWRRRWRPRRIRQRHWIGAYLGQPDGWATAEGRWSSSLVKHDKPFSKRPQGLARRMVRRQRIEQKLKPTDPRDRGEGDLR